MQTTRPNGIAPSTSRFRSGAKGGKVARAWQHVWDQLDHTEFKEAVPMAWAAAEKFGLQPASVLAHLHLMAAEGILERKQDTVEVQVERPKGVFFTSTRNRTFYRIAQ
jgi:predicted ArsR family transcriptional regulator